MAMNTQVNILQESNTEISSFPLDSDKSPWRAKDARQQPQNGDGHETKPSKSEKGETIFVNSKINTNIKEHELEWWLGTVIEIHNKYFTALLEDLKGRKNIVKFDKEDIYNSEKELLFIGSRFTYSVSVIDRPGRSGREYSTKIAFSSRRKWLKKYEEKIAEYAEKIFPEKLLDL